MLIGLDLDGTLLDSRLRHMVTLQRAAEALAVPLSEDDAQEFFQEKREGNSGIEALRRLGIPSAENISLRWIEMIETEEMLALDRLYPDTMDALMRQWARKSTFVLATGRHDQAAARRQISRLGLQEFFCAMIFVDPLDRSQTKAAATRRYDLGAIVGDTEIDLRWAADLGVSFHASSYGFRSENYWQRHQITSHVTLSEIFDVINLPEPTRSVSVGETFPTNDRKMSRS